MNTPHGPCPCGVFISRFSYSYLPPRETKLEFQIFSGQAKKRGINAPQTISSFAIWSFMLKNLDSNDLQPLEAITPTSGSHELDCVCQRDTSPRFGKEVARTRSSAVSISQWEMSQLRSFPLAFLIEHACTKCSLLSQHCLGKNKFDSKLKHEQSSSTWLNKLSAIACA